MKILQVIAYFNPKFGGDVYVCDQISRFLVKRGHKVTIVTTDCQSSEEYITQLRDHSIEVHQFHCIYAYAKYFYSPSLKKWLNQNIQNYDIVHLHDFRSYQNSLVRKYAVKYHIPYIISPHASTPNKGDKKFLKWLYDVIFGYRLIRDASHIIAGSQEEQPYDIQWGALNDQISIIYPGMDLEKYRSIPEKGLFKKKLGIDGKVILYLGRLHKLKGIDYCIQAYAALKGKYNNLFLVIAGPDDGEKKNLEKIIIANKIEQNVFFTGFLQEHEKLSAYVDADVFILTPQYMGGVGLTPLEAILCGTPVIVNDACGEVVKLSECGYLVQYGDVDELKEKMIFALENPEYNKKLVENGKKFMAENLTWEKVGERVESILYKCHKIK
jgi:glycosyltransferase involved in cell wall biosynthesis